ncbi:glycosyltransferase family protein [Pseudoroseomonas ludipueritiae]|uniref:Uncharacterized protein n=1 Tax=Pseudoroseomonas ludipueritiae TaxID=198093 RepID=A0ABR7RF13_9PROT|nr:hypothetical protein [Pseudoroseomonas ludipueritiae]MBC9180015.1 hypothetical protein [Pseudoroseomonas ludipueritiae]
MKTILSFVANDRMLHYLKPFLASFRRSMPEQEAWMISYDGDDAQSRALAARYGIGVVGIDTFHPEVEAVSRQMKGRFIGHFRKLEALYLPCDVLMMIDIDVVVNRDLSPLFAPIAEGKADLLYGEQTWDWVYTEQGRALFPKSALFSTGMLVLRPEVFTVPAIQACIAGNAAEFDLCRHPKVHDQPLLNYFCDRSGLAVASAGRLVPGISSYNHYLRKEIQPSWMGAMPRFMAGDREVAFIHFAGLKSTEGEFRFRMLLDYYRYLCDAGAAPPA